MQFKIWGEEQFVDYLKKQFPSKGAFVGIGDDCAVIPGVDEASWLVTTDALVEGVHFLKNEISAKDLGYKAVAVNISDIVAMGGCPKYLFLSIAIPKESDCVWIRDIIQGIKDACKEWDLLLLGGDTVGSKRDVFMNLTVIGSASNSKIKYRHLAKSNDLICLTGYLGDSGGGLKAMQKHLQKNKDIEYLIQAHFHPVPHLKQGMWLADRQEVHSMMDISDGLDCDLKRLIKSSKMGAFVDTSKIPISDVLKRVCLENSWDALQLALTGGEDYCLLFTVAREGFDRFQEEFEKEFNQKPFVIGRISDESQELVYLADEKEIRVNYANFDHFQ